MSRHAEVRSLHREDAVSLSKAFSSIGWDKPVSLFERYLSEQEKGLRECWIATVDGRMAGYVTLLWSVTTYPPLVGTGIPGIVDLNVLPEFRRRGVATQLLDQAEFTAAARSAVVAIGVGLHPGYNAAQRLYVKRGYVPDGLGVTYEDRFVKQGESVRFDDSLELHFTKELNRSRDLPHN